MKGIVLALIFLFVTGKSPTAHPQQIEVQEGDNVTIQCQNHSRNLEKYTLDVKRDDGSSGDLTRVVYSRRHGKDHPSPQMKQYRNRVVLIKKDLRMGVVTVVIHSVQRSDGGLYKCYIPKLQRSSYFTIVVKDKQSRTEENDFTTTATAVEMTDAGETDAATKKPHHPGVITIVVAIVVTIAIVSLLVGVVFLVLVKKGICVSRNVSEGNSFELETLNGQARR